MKVPAFRFEEFQASLEKNAPEIFLKFLKTIFGKIPNEIFSEIRRPLSTYDLNSEVKAQISNAVKIKSHT